jgi:hypothetical protein
VTKPTRPDDFGGDKLPLSLNSPGCCSSCYGTPMPEPGLSTAQVARMFGVQAATLRVALCKKGHYHGIRPKKRANRLLLWPAAEVRAVLEAGQRR